MEGAYKPVFEASHTANALCLARYDSSRGKNLKSEEKERSERRRSRSVLPRGAQICLGWDAAEAGSRPHVAIGPYESSTTSSIIRQPAEIMHGSFLPPI